MNNTSLENKTFNWWNQWLQWNPNWFELTLKLDWLWLLHCYGFASIYFALSCITLFAVLSLRSSLTSHPHFSSLNIFLLIFGLSRAICLYFDPYGSKNLFPKLFGKIIWDIAFPCIFSALALLHLGFVHELNEVKFGPSIVTNESCIFIIITANFCSVIASDILFTLENSFIIVWLLIQILFVVWSICICIAFLCRCSHLLSTIAKLDIVHSNQNSQNDNLLDNKSSASAEVKPISSDNVINENNPEANLNNDLNVADVTASKPKIKITDENELTVSYASDNTPSQYSARNTTDSGNNSRSVSPKRCNSSSIYRQSPKINIYSKKHLRSKTNKNSRRNSNELHSPVIESEITSNFEESELKIEIQKRGLRSVLQQEFNIYSQTQKSSNRNIFKNLLKRVIILMIYGLSATVFQIIGIIGPHGLFEDQYLEIILWFSYQTAYRTIELLIIFTTVSVTTKSFHNYNERSNFKQRSSPYC